MPAGQQVPEGRGEGQGKPLYHHHRYNLRHRFELGKTLGTGTYGKVKHAVEKVTSEEVAIKYIKKTKIQDEADLNRIRREIRILSRLNHPNIVNVREVFEKKDRIILVMDCALGGELYEYVATRQTVDLDEARRIFLQIAQAIHYAHQQGVVHRDLKLENIILDHNHNVKVADFGLANFFRKGELLHTFCGSPLYASPEIVNGTPYRGPEVDIWSLGVVLYTLVHGSMPFESADLKMLRHQITSGLYHEPPSHTEADSLIRHMLRVDPAERATLEDVLSHPWVTKHPSPHPHPTGVSQASPSTPHGACSETSFDEDEALFDIGRCKSPLGLGGHESNEELPHPSEDSYPYPDLPPTCPEADLSPSSEVFSQEETTSFCREDVGVYGEEEDEEVDAIFPEQPEGHSSVSDDASPSPETCADSCEINTGSDVSTSGDETRKIFDSERKPRRGILKRRGKFSGGDSGCILQEDPYPCRPEDWDPTPTLQPQPVLSPLPCDPLPPNPDAANTLGATTPSVLPSQEQPTSFSSGDVSDCSQLGASLPLPSVEAEDASICPSNSAPSVCTCSSKGNSAVIRRRGILKRGSLVDPKKRLSVGSTSSNSSADLLDLSYDSGEGEQFLAMLASEGAGDTPRDLEGPPCPGGYQPRFPMEMYALETRVEVDSYVPRFPPEQYELHMEREADPRDCQDLEETLMGEEASESAIRQDGCSPPPTEASSGSVPYKPRFPPERYNLSDSGPATLPFRYSPGAFSEAMRAGANEERDLAGARRRLRELRLFFTRPATQRSGGDIAALNLAGEGQWGRRGSRPEGQERLLDLDDADVVIKALEICSRVR